MPESPQTLSLVERGSVNCYSILSEAAESLNFKVFGGLKSMSIKSQAMLGIWGITSLYAFATAEEPMPPAVESAAASAAPLSEEYLQRWTPGGDTNALDLPYPHKTAEFQKETDNDWRDDRWQHTDKGPLVSHSILLPGYQVSPKVAAVTAGSEKYFLYDLESGSFVAGVTSGNIQIDLARYGLLNRPTLTGDVTFYRSAERMWRQGQRSTGLPATAIDYQGHYRSGNRVLLVSHLGDVEVLESPLPCNEAEVIQSEIELAAHDEDLWLTLAVGNEHVELTDNGHAATWTDKQGEQHSVAIDAASPGVKLEQDDTALLLHWPAAQAPTSARVCYDIQDANGVVAGDAATQKNPPQLTALKQPGGRHWGDPLVTAGVLDGESNAPYVIDRISPPYDNPFAALFFLTGIDFFPNGDAAVCSAHGDVWIVRGLDESLKHVTWQRFATGLYQPLGLEIVDGKVIVLGRDQLTRLHDQNDDGEADFYESFNHDLVIQGLPHAFAMRLERTPDGSFVFLKSGEGPHGSALLHLSADGKRLDVLARGFRHPFGLGVGPNGEVTVADNEGNWVPSSKIDLITPGGFYGFLGSATTSPENQIPLRPLCFIPKVADNSSGGQFWQTSDSWGTYHRGKMFHFSWGRCTLHAVLEQQVGVKRQAATVQIPGLLFQSGPGEAEFSPRDGQLYVAELDGWQTAAEVDGSLERIRYTGKPVRLPSSFAAHEDGIVLGFDEPLDPSSLSSKESIGVEQWNYKWSSTYGSYHYSITEPERVGHDVVQVEEASLSPDRKHLFLRINGLRQVDQIQVSLNVRTADGATIETNVYGTINALDPPYEAKLQPSATRAVPNALLRKLLAKDNLVAWCIVPFDIKHRGPEERAAMLERLGIHRIAYDWREEHVPQFDDELAAYDRHGIKLHAFWMPVNTEKALDEPHWPLVLDLVKRHNLRPELWTMLNNALVDSLPEEERAQRAAEILAPAAKAAAERGCKLGLYNHGGWFGEPDHQIAIIEALHKMNVDNVGIVYNFHHGHEHIADFAALTHRMEPYLLTVNVNGMRVGGPKILSLGDGDQEMDMLNTLVDAGYMGPIGILGHRENRDAEECLQESLNWIERLDHPR